MSAGLRLAFVIAGGYLVGAGLWIAVSDRVVAAWIDDAAALSVVQTWKGLGFVVVSSILIGMAIWWFERVRDRHLEDLRETEVRLRASEQRFARFLDHSPLAAWITDGAGELTWGSKGYRPELMQGDNRRAVLAGVEAALAEQRSLVSVERLSRRDGPDADYLVYRFPADDRGESIGFVAADLAERVHDASQLRAELDALVYAVSHDLRAPLRSLTGFTTALQEDYGDRFDEQGAHFLSRIQDASETMGRLIDGLLELSGVSSQSVKRKPVDLAVIGRQEIERLRRSMPHRRVEAVMPASIPVSGDPQLLHQAVVHLVGNAWKYTADRDDARIEMRLERKEAGDEVVLSDNGRGFDMAYAHKLFTPFQRLHGEKRFAGTGIGLAITQRIIQKHGGRIWIESQIGGGTTVRFTMG